MLRSASVLLALALPLAAREHRIAVVGLVHSHVWGHLDRMIKGGPARLVGVAEPNPELAAEARKMGVSENLLFTDYRKMLDQVKPDIVWAFVENNRHLEIVEVCAPRKIHVMFEKPLASSHKEALAVQRLAQKHAVQVMTNYQMAWWPANHAAKSQADSGALGKIWRLHGIVGHGGPGSSGVRSKFFFAWLTDPVKNGAGALVDFGCYNALWSLWYLGRPDSVYAQAIHLRPEVFPKVEDSSTLVLSYKHAVSILEGSWNLPRGFQDLEVFGLNGSLSVGREKVELRKGRERPEEILAGPLPPERGEPVAHLVHALDNNQPLEPLVGLDLNVGVVEILDAAKTSIATGKAVRLQPKPAR